MGRIRVTHRWDGSYLGSYSSDVIISTVKDRGINYILTNINNIYEYSTIIMTTNILPCIIDELKMIFNQPKLGTHMVRIDSKKYIMIRCISRSPMEVERILSLKEAITYYDLDENKEFNHNVRKAIALREILGLPCNISKSTIVRRIKDKYEVLSYHDISHLELQKSAIPNSYIKKWFRNDDLSNTIKELLNLKGDESSNEITRIIMRYRESIEKVIRRIDSDYIWILGYIINRISKYMISN